MAYITKTVPVGSLYNPTSGAYQHSDTVIGTLTNWDRVNLTFDVSNILTTDIGNVLGLSTRNLGLLASSNKVNKYALFRPNGLAPYKMGDFAGYNHFAKPPTYYLNKITSKNSAGSTTKLGFLLRRGERPPYLDTADCDWSKIKVRVYSIGGDISGIDESVVTQAVNDYNILDSITINHPSNDYYTVILRVQATYVNQSNQNIKNIEDSHPDITLTITPTFTNLNLTLVNYSLRYQTLKHYYYYMDNEYVVTDFNVIYTNNLNSPKFGIMTTPIPRIMNGNYSYGKSEGTIAGTGTVITFHVEDNLLSVNDEFKKDNVWYKVTSKEDGYLASTIK